MISRQYGPGGSTPAKPVFSNLTLSEEEIAEIEWRFESPKPYLKPGKFVWHLRVARETSVRNHLCEAPEGPVPGKWFLTLISRPLLTGSARLRMRRT